ncbi:Mediator of RNA polymerase II transcription subunit 17 [Penicillium argentinense]|uniref:Mediator of RNA polymerase II transcription subunit 17 n=1 Tax=Penicillium argentinense TaxID=1131581 RepID=A0A9W9G223_9EURO|nr:Mediator of RNA polymerase II transcription subunit 17 [Penicillium argentinense]KAJ5110538.1 Mediator of RNA polymerase II transcription subunit 17 [Penicillium argentinense]
MMSHAECSPPRHTSTPIQVAFEVAPTVPFVTMGDTFNLPLRPHLEKGDHHDTLPAEISQINQQWGSFRDVNEEVLLAKMAEEDAAGGAVESIEEEDENEMTTTERLEELYKKRAEMLQFAMTAHTEATMALDFVSLLLSKWAPRQAESCMSPYLKHAVPLGSIDVDIVNPPPLLDSVAQNSKAVSSGWRLYNFNFASKKLLSAAGRLENEVDIEARYWDSVLEIKEQGWKICRHPREGQTLAVQYGFLEATPVFRNRGLATLRRAHDGTLNLYKGLVPPGSPFVRVSVLRCSTVTGSTTPPASLSDTAKTIHQQILHARDSVFEDELFYELLREAKSMMDCGVTTRHNSIQIPVTDDVEILLELVDAEESLRDEPENAQLDTQLAEGVAYSMRILLSFAHRLNHRRRIRPPAPLASEKPRTPEYHLFRPSLAYLQHVSQARCVESFIHGITGVMRSSGFQLPEYTTEILASLKINQNLPPMTELSALESLMINFLEPIESVFKVNLLTPNSSFTIKMRTNVLEPPYGTHFNVTYDLPAIPDLRSPGNLEMRHEVEAAVTHALLLDIVTKVSSSNKKSSNNMKQWEAIYPHIGELRLPLDYDTYKKMQISLSRDNLTISTNLIHSPGGRGFGEAFQRKKTVESKTWTLRSSDNPNEHSSALDFVAAETA